MALTLAQVLLIAPIMIGPAAAALMQGAKHAPQIPINTGSAALIRCVLVIVSVLCSAALSWASGSLAAFDFNAALQAVLQAVTVYATASAAYEHMPTSPK